MTVDSSVRNTIIRALNDAEKRCDRESQYRHRRQAANAEATAAREQEKFREFVQRASLPIAIDSIESANPPEPDLICRHFTEGPIAFELVEICAEEIAKKISWMSKTADTTYIRSMDPSSKIIQEKVCKNYITRLPIELLCYTAGRTISADSEVVSNLRAALEKNSGLFQRVWFMGDKCHQVWPDFMTLDGSERTHAG
jgi:hypothetical protein